mgnify:CR=1 FL=1
MTSEITVLNNLRTYYNDNTISEIKTVVELDAELSRLETEEISLLDEETLLTSEEISLTNEEKAIDSRITEINNLLADESMESQNKEVL